MKKNYVYGLLVALTLNAGFFGFASAMDTNIEDLGSQHKRFHVAENLKYVKISGQHALITGACHVASLAAIFDVDTHTLKPTLISALCHTIGMAMISYSIVKDDAPQGYNMVWVHSSRALTALSTITSWLSFVYDDQNAQIASTIFNFGTICTLCIGDKYWRRLEKKD